MATIPIKEFVGVKAKMYSIKTVKSQKKTTKGVQSIALKKQDTHDTYKSSLKNIAQTRVTVKQIMSVNHDIFTAQKCKLAF